MIDDRDDIEALRDEAAEEMAALLAESRANDENPDLDGLFAGAKLTIKDDD